MPRHFKWRIISPRRASAWDALLKTTHRCHFFVSFVEGNTKRGCFGLHCRTGCQKVTRFGTHLRGKKGTHLRGKRGQPFEGKKEGTHLRGKRGRPFEGKKEGTHLRGKRGRPFEGKKRATGSERRQNGGNYFSKIFWEIKLGK